jgi:hypothetical protein
VHLRSDRYSYHCWGYGFDWQTRTDLVPGKVPNIICTTFVANALLDLHAERSDPQLLQMATSAAHFIRDVLLTRGTDGELWFSYTPVAPSQVHNANLLGAALLARIGFLQSDGELIRTALEATRFTVRRQYPDGAWDYGERDQPSQRWKDNFHTGFNLCALRAIERWAETSEFKPALLLGLDYYCANFFCPGGAPKYFHNRVYPIDVHSVAQSLITLTSLRDLTPECDLLRNRVWVWAGHHLWDGAAGYFFYQKWPFLTVRIPYMRWGQAWMLTALATMLEAGNPLPHALEELTTAIR